MDQGRRGGDGKVHARGETREFEFATELALMTSPAATGLAESGEHNSRAGDANWTKPFDRKTTYDIWCAKLTGSFEQVRTLSHPFTAQQAAPNNSEFRSIYG